MKTLAAILAFGLLAEVNAAGDPQLAEFTRPDPALRSARCSDSCQDGPGARWVGNISLSGVLVVEFDRAPLGEEQPDVDGIAHFEPDKKSLAALPAARKNHPLEPRLIWIGEGGRSVLTPLIGQAAFDRLQAGTPGRYEFPATLFITELITGIDCDQRWFRAEYKHIRLSPAPMLALREAQDIGC